MRISAIRGILLEEVVLHLLTLVGYRTIQPGEDGTRDGHSGLEVQGRGEWHQIDALAAFDSTPAFMYPLRLLVEAKCYANNRRVKIGVARNAVGVLKDIGENYFSYRPNKRATVEVKVPRFNYHSAIFSTSGYTTGAQRYAMAHQVFLIQYDRVPLLEPIRNGLLALTNRHVQARVMRGSGGRATKLIRDHFRRLLEHGPASWTVDNGAFSQSGEAHLHNGVIEPLRKIEGSYFGMLQGRWPLHLVSASPLPAEAFANTDEVRCRVHGRVSDRWSFSPVDANENGPGWFRLEFDIPNEVLRFVESARNDPRQLAAVKQDHFSFLTVAGLIGGVRRQVRLILDEEWLEAYKSRLKKKMR